VLSEDNAVVVGRLTRNEALLALKKRGLAAYTRSLACITDFGLELA
jgi:hypothetical protein